jgi:hypothetical protein
MTTKRTALIAAWMVAGLLCAGAAQAGTGTLTGVLRYVDPATNVDQGLSDAYVYIRSAAVSPPLEKFFSKPDYVLGPSVNGGFSVTVPEGTYYVRLLRRQTVTPGGQYGPPEDGDLTWFNQGTVTVAAGATVDLGTRYAAPFYIYPVTITGIISNSTGPFAGRYVRAQTVPCYEDGYDSNVNECGPNKYLATQKTDSNGRYTLYLRDPGTYYIYTSACLTTAYNLYTGNKCPETAGPVVTVTRGQVLNLNFKQ